MKPKELDWFIRRIGKRIYRNPTIPTCCPTCKNVEENGIVVGSKSHAQYLLDCENDYGAEGIDLNYRDKK